LVFPSNIVAGHLFGLAINQRRYPPPLTLEEQHPNTGLLEIVGDNQLRGNGLVKFFASRASEQKR
jgi:hypothetical protein